MTNFVKNISSSELGINSIFKDVELKVENYDKIFTDKLIKVIEYSNVEFNMTLNSNGSSRFLKKSMHGFFANIIGHLFKIKDTDFEFKGGVLIIHMEILLILLIYSNLDIEKHHLT